MCYYKEDWTKEAPTEKGWYWAIENLEPGEADLFLVRFDGTDKVLTKFHPDEFDIHFFSHWMGPLKSPTELPDGYEGAMEL
jgi:hypothetical protein